MRDRDLCGNCDAWREEHYNARGEWIGETLEPPCGEYYGINPDAKRAAKKQEETAYLHDAEVGAP